MIIKYNSSLYPNGYNIIPGQSFTKELCSKGGKSDIGHEKQSIKTKEKYKNIDFLKNLGDIPRGISYCSRVKNKIKYEGFVVRKKGIKKSFIYSINTNKLSYALSEAKKYLSLNQIE